MKYLLEDLYRSPDRKAFGATQYGGSITIDRSEALEFFRHDKLAFLENIRVIYIFGGAAIWTI